MWKEDYWIGLGVIVVQCIAAVACRRGKDMDTGPGSVAVTVPSPCVYRLQRDKITSAAGSRTGEPGMHRYW